MGGAEEDEDERKGEERGSTERKGEGGGVGVSRERANRMVGPATALTFLGPC